MVATVAAMAGDATLGERIYRQGILPSGQPLSAKLQQGLALSGARAACGACHRRSGFGVGEGYTPIRPITGRYLFQDANAPNPRMYRPSGTSPGMRPAYSDATLARAVRSGIDSAGRVLDGMMPRYQFEDADLDHLTAYLKTLSAQPDPGVTEAQLHFATIVDSTANPVQRQAMLEIIEAFFRDKNAGTRLEDLRARRAPWDMAREYKSYRKWQLHVWTLEGEPSTWAAQLEAHYRRQPVFAVLSGIGAGDWQPVHDFCERTKLPCLFPNIDLPPHAPGQYTLYLSRGLTMEAEALALHLAREAVKGPIVQVYRDEFEAAADAFQQALAAAGIDDLSDRRISTNMPPDADFWGDVGQSQPATLVLWLKADDLTAISDLIPYSGQVYLSARLVSTPVLPDALARQTALVYPWELPQKHASPQSRLRAWLKMKGITVREGPVQINTFFALSQASMAVSHMVDDYSRDYLIERIEHGLDNTLAPSAYPRPSLGPGQRFASKGTYIVQVDPASPDRLVPVSGWIVP